MHVPPEVVIGTQPLMLRGRRKAKKSRMSTSCIRLIIILETLEILDVGEEGHGALRREPSFLQSCVVNEQFKRTLPQKDLVSRK